jgi:hypothetical protein
MLAAVTALTWRNRLSACTREHKKRALTITVATASEDTWVAGAAAALTVKTDRLCAAIGLATDVALADLEDRNNAPN